MKLVAYQTWLQFNGSWCQAHYFESRDTNFKSRGRIYATRGAMLKSGTKYWGLLTMLAPWGLGWDLFSVFQFYQLWLNLVRLCYVSLLTLFYIYLINFYFFYIFYYAKNSVNFFFSDSYWLPKTDFRFLIYTPKIMYFKNKNKCFFNACKVKKKNPKMIIQFLEFTQMNYVAITHSLLVSALKMTLNAYLVKIPEIAGAEFRS